MKNTRKVVSSHLESYCGLLAAVVKGRCDEAGIECSTKETALSTVVDVVIRTMMSAPIGEFYCTPSITPTLKLIELADALVMQGGDQASARGILGLSDTSESSIVKIGTFFSSTELGTLVERVTASSLGYFRSLVDNEVSVRISTSPAAVEHQEPIILENAEGNADAIPPIPGRVTYDHLDEVVEGVQAEFHSLNAEVPSGLQCFIDHLPTDALPEAA